MRSAVDGLDRAVTRVLGAGVALLLAAAAGLGIYQVVMRFVLEQPSSWSEALSRTLIIWMVYLGAALAARGGLLVAVDVTRSMVGRSLCRLLDVVALAVTTAFFVVVAWFGFLITLRVRLQNLAGLEVSIGWAYAALPVGTGIAAVVTLVTILRILLGADAPADSRGEQS